MVLWFAAVTCHNWEHNRYPVIQIFLHNQSLYCFSAWNCFSSSGAMKQWAWCKQNVEMVERTAALRNLNLLAGIGCLEFQKEMAGMDSWNKHVEQISFRQCITFREHRQLKGWQPPLPTHCGKKAVSRQLFIGLQQSHVTTESTMWPNAFLLCMKGVLFSVAATKGWA